MFAKYRGHIHTYLNKILYFIPVLIKKEQLLKQIRRSVTLCHEKLCKFIYKKKIKELSQKYT